MVTIGIFDSTILISFLFPEEVVDGERPLKFLLKLFTSKIYNQTSKKWAA
jgi:hypothetical protein